MQTILSKIDQLIQSLSALPALSDARKRELDNKFRLEFNYNSNHIEGNTLTYGETKLLLWFDKTEGVHELREFEEMKAHDAAYKMIQEWAKDKERPVQEVDIKALNEVILVRPFYKEALTADGQPTRRLIKVGEYKEFPNSVLLSNGEMFEYASPIDTPIKMAELMAWYYAELEKNELHPVVLAALFHYRFVCIHPFDDGNGRLSRLLMNYVLLCHGLPPVVIKSADKKNYLNALNQADSGNVEAFVKYIADQLVWSLDLSIKAAKGESLDEPDDLDKKLALLERDLNAVGSEKEVQVVLTPEVFDNIYTSWLSDLIKDVVTGIQKFDKFFMSATHYATLLPSGNTITNFPDNKVWEGINDVLTRAEGFYPSDYGLRIAASYGILKKGGVKSFNCLYEIQFSFGTTTYTIISDTFISTTQKKKETLFERLLHQPITPKEISSITNHLTNAIYEHIDAYTKENGLR